MKKYHIGIGAIIILVGLVLTSSFFVSKQKNIDKENIIINSPDEIVTLSIPTTALASDFDVNDISVTTVTNRNLAENDSDYFSFYEFELGPTGTTFPEPIDVAITVDYIENTQGSIYHIADDGTLQGFDDIDVNRDEDKNKITYSVKITHFSRITFSLYRNFVTVFDIPQVQAVGVPFEAVINVRKNIKTREYTTDDDVSVYEALIEDDEDKVPSLYNGHFRALGPLSPAEEAGVPAKAKITQDSYRINQTFLCEEPGHVILTYSVRLDWHMLSVYNNQIWGFLDFETSHHRFQTQSVQVEFDCIDVSGFKNVDQSGIIIDEGGMVEFTPF